MRGWPPSSDTLEDPSTSEQVGAGHVRSWFPAIVAMPRLLVQLAKKPELGLLDARTFCMGRDVIVVHYWRSVEDLGRFAKDTALARAPAWAAFNQHAAGSGNIGIWHETYRVPADQIKTRYGNMPPFGSGRAHGVRERLGSPRNDTHSRRRHPYRSRYTTLSSIDLRGTSRLLAGRSSTG
ncbi:MAG: monooxygenase family protein [Mycobacterium sp.]